jgi:hypothetical protein
MKEYTTPQFSQRLSARARVAQMASAHACRGAFIPLQRQRFESAHGFEALARMSQCGPTFQNILKIR